jgi:WD40 repeat protein
MRRIVLGLLVILSCCLAGVAPGQVRCSKDMNGMGTSPGLLYSRDGRQLIVGSRFESVMWLDRDLSVVGYQRQGVPVARVALSPDGDLLASGPALSGPIVFWDARTRQRKAVVRWHERPVNALQFHPTEKVLIAMYWDGTIRSWTPSGEHKCLYISRKDSLRSLAIPPDGKTMLVGTEEGELRFVSYPDGDVLQTLQAHEQDTSAVVLSHDGSICYSASGRDPVLKSWDCSSGEQLGSFSGHTKGIFCLAISPQDKYLASAGVDRIVRIWDTSTGALLGSVMHEHDHCSAICFSPDGTELAASFHDDQLIVYDVKKMIAGGDRNR